MIGRTATRLLIAGLLGLSVSAVAHANRLGGRGGGGFTASPGFHGGGFHHFHGGFHTRVFIGGTFFAAPFYYPPPYYYYPPAYYPPAYYPPATEYIEPPAAPAAAYWYYCPGARAYYPYVRDCPGGWQQVAPQPPQ